MSLKQKVKDYEIFYKITWILFNFWIKFNTYPFPNLEKKQLHLEKNAKAKSR
jgi:hypothetical protein